MINLLFIGTTELMLIAAIALLLFGGKKLPEMMRGLGQGVREFKSGLNEKPSQVDEETAEGTQAKQVGKKDNANKDSYESQETDERR